jgi:putative DNA-invertase from lambdoid prophage Rac
MLLGTLPARLGMAGNDASSVSRQHADGGGDQPQGAPYAPQWLAPSLFRLHSRLVERPEGRRLFDKLRAGDVLVVRWVDRLGRNYEDVCDTIREFMRRGVVIRTVINNFTFDGATRDPMQRAVRDALIAFMAATSQAQAEATKAAQRAGIEHARANDDRAYLGRKLSFTRDQLNKVRTMLGKQTMGIAQIAKETGLTRQTIYRIKDDPAGAEAALVAWGL